MSMPSLLHAVPAGNIEDDQTAESTKPASVPKCTRADPSAYCRVQEGSDDHPQQVDHGDGTDNGDHRHLADLPLHKCAGVLKQIRFGEREQGDRQNRDQLRTDRKEHEVQLCAHHTAGGCVDHTDFRDQGNDQNGDDRAVQGRVNVADLLGDQAVKGPGEDDPAAIEEVGLRQVDQGVEPGDCHDPDAG